MVQFMIQFMTQRSTEQFSGQSMVQSGGESQMQLATCHRRAWVLARARILLLLCIGESLISSSLSQAYVPSVTSKGVPIHWNQPVQLNLFGNSANQSSLSAERFSGAVVAGLQRWQSASGGSVHFNFWQGTDPDRYPQSSDLDGISSIYFSSAKNTPRPSSTGARSTPKHLSPTILGMTQVWFKSDSGEILEIDIELNDVDFHFTDNPKDTSGSGNGIFSTGISVDSNTGRSEKSRVYIQNVITHELGHGVGLSHSGGLQSTMLFAESPEQAHLGCDELVGIHALYPTSDQSERGELHGRVVSESGLPVFGAHVLAISQSRGTVLASALTNSAGEYSIAALEPGAYFLLVEPFFAGVEALPSYYSRASSSICRDHTPFSRSFLTESDRFHLKPVSVLPSQKTEAPQCIVRCAENGGAAVSSLPASHGGLVRIERASESNNFGFVDRVWDSPSRLHSNSNAYRLEGISGYISIHVLAFSLYSPIKTAVTLLDAGGSPVADSHEPVYRGDSGYINYDSMLERSHLPKGDYTLRVTSDPLMPDAYPAGPVSLDEVPFLVILVSNDPFNVSSNDSSLYPFVRDLERPSMYSSIDPSMYLSMYPSAYQAVHPPLNEMIPLNPRCRQDENFPPYSSPPRPPSFESAAPDQRGVGFCGTIEKPLIYRSSRSDGWSVIGWALPWLFCAFTLLVRHGYHAHSRG